MTIDVYQIVTDRIIARMEKGEIPWKKPWVCLGGANVAYKRANKEPYSLLNQMLLGEPGEYASFKQWQEAGAHVKKGEKGSISVWWKIQSYPIKDNEGNPMMGKNGQPMMKTVPILKYNTVFHISQVEPNDPDKPIKPRIASPDDVQMPNSAIQISNAEKFFSDYRDKYGIAFHNGGDRAYYFPDKDEIRLPLMAQFHSTGEYYSTLAHEHVHSTGHKSRLNRISKTAAFGNADYGKEELVAEMGAAICMNMLGLTNEATETNSAAYLQNWLKAIRDDKRLIVDAASAAAKAVKLIFNIKDENKEDKHED